MRPLKVRLAEYRDNLSSLSEQTQVMAERMEKVGLDAQAFSDLAELYGLIANDLTKLLNKEELSKFAVLVEL